MRRTLLESLGFPSGYSVEAAHLVDIHRAHGLGAMVQVDLEQRVHRVRPTAELGRMAHRIMHALLRRLPASPHRGERCHTAAPYHGILWDGQAYRLTTEELEEIEFPPLAKFAGIPGVSRKNHLS